MYADRCLRLCKVCVCVCVDVCMTQVCKQYSAFRLLGIGMGVWATACVLCGLAPTFWTLMLSRVFVGVGEASFVALAAPFIGQRTHTHTHT